MNDSSIDSRMREQDPDLTKQADKQLPEVDPHSAGATPSDVVVKGASEHGFGAALPKGEATKPQEVKAPAKTDKSQPPIKEPVKPVTKSNKK